MNCNKLNFKKFIIQTLAAVLVAFSCFALFGCKSKQDNLVKLSKELSNYEINLNLDNQSKTVSASQTVEYLNTSEAILSKIKFHVYPKYFEQGATDKVVPQTKVNKCYKNGLSYCQFEVKKLQVSGVETGVVFEGENDGILSVGLSSSLMPSERVKIYMEYTIKLPNCEHRFGYGGDTINLANFYPIACVYKDGEFSSNPYNANGDPFFSDCANYNVNITADSNLVVAGTGNKSEILQKEGKTTTNFKALVVRDFACVLSEKFKVKSDKIGKVQINYFYYNDGNSDLALKASVDAIGIFSDLFGDYPYEVFNVVKCDFLHGGMEYPNLVMISDDIDDLDEYLNVIVHETAHQWWYGVVGNDEYTLPWLDEAITEFSTALFYDKNSDYNLTHKKIIEGNKQNYSLFITVYQDVLGSVDTSLRAVDQYDTEPEYTYCTYVKGCLMYESLYSLLGEKKFLKALNNYFQNNKFSNAQTIDLVNAFSAASGSDMQSFFDSWIKGKVVLN